MKTAFLSSGSDSYGVRRSLETLFRGFREEGVDPILICLEAGDMVRYAEDRGIPTFVCPVGRPKDFHSPLDVARNFQFMFNASASLRNTILESGADNLIVRQPYQMPLAARACHLARKRAYWLMPNMLSDKYPFRLNARIFDLILARYGMVAIANSACTRKSLIDTFAVSTVAHLGIDPAEFHPDEIPASREKYGFRSDAPLIGIFGRIWEPKGQKVFIQALFQVRNEFPDIQLAICGGPLDSAYGQDLRSTIDSLNLADRVLLMGSSDKLSDTLPSLYAMCDITVNSRLDPEPFGLSVIESMLMAKPVLAHQAGGPGETIIDGETGWLMDAPTVESFVEGIRRSMRDRPQWERLGQQALAHARLHYSHVAAARRIISIIKTQSTD